jgi:hypothetical protein
MRARVFVWRDGQMRQAGTLTLRGKRIVPKPDSPLLREMATGPVKVITRQGFEMIGPTPDPALYLAALPRAYTGMALRVALDPEMQEAITRTPDGKFASQGPCPESGCGRGAGHEGGHRERADEFEIGYRDPVTFRTVENFEADAPPTFTSIEEAESWLVRNYVHLTVNLQPLEGEQTFNIATINTIVHTWYDLANRFPEVARHITALTVESPVPGGGGDWTAWEGTLAAAAYHREEKITRLHFNPTYLVGERFTETTREMSAKGWFATNDVGGNVAHEFGHAIHNYVNQSGDLGMLSLPMGSGFGQTRTTFWAWVNHMKGTGEAPSKYAKTNPKEMFAETFAAWFNQSLNRQTNETKAVAHVDDLLRAVVTSQPLPSYMQYPGAKEATVEHTRLAARLGLPPEAITNAYAMANPEPPKRQRTPGF